MKNLTNEEQSAKIVGNIIVGIIAILGATYIIVGLYMQINHLQTMEITVFIHGVAHTAIIIAGIATLID